MDTQITDNLPKSKIKKFILWFFLVVLTILCVVIAINFYLNPLIFRSAAHVEVATILNQGKSFAVHDPNLDFRGLRRAHIQMMAKAPDVVIFAGSRFEAATEKTFPNRSFYNAFVHNDYFEDMLAIVGLLDKANKLPKTLVLSIRHISFVPMEKRATEEWKMFSDEYKYMADKLGLGVASFYQTFPFNHYLQLLSLELGSHGISQEFKHTIAPYGATEQWILDDMDVIHPDGSISFSRNHTVSFTAEAAREDSIKRAKQSAQTQAAQLTEENKMALGKLLDYLHQKGVQTVIAITPHHPTFWEGIKNANYSRTLSQLETTVKEFAQAHHLVVVGSFDPNVAGCVESSFRDYIHLDEVCLKIIFDQIPPIK